MRKNEFLAKNKAIFRVLSSPLAFALYIFINGVSWLSIEIFRTFIHDLRVLREERHVLVESACFGALNVNKIRLEAQKSLIFRKSKK
jgi:hypothetical protein